MAKLNQLFISLAFVAVVTAVVEAASKCSEISVLVWNEREVDTSCSLCCNDSTTGQFGYWDMKLPASYINCACDKSLAIKVQAEPDFKECNEIVSLVGAKTEEIEKRCSECCSKESRTPYGYWSATTTESSEHVCACGVHLVTRVTADSRAN